MGDHQWEYREGCEINPLLSWHGHYGCVLCGTLGPHSPAPDLTVVDRFVPKGPCPGVSGVGTTKCRYCGLRQVWETEYCPRCDYPELGPKSGPKEYYEAHLGVQARKAAR